MCISGRGSAYPESQQTQRIRRLAPTLVRLRRQSGGRYPIAGATARPDRLSMPAPPSFRVSFGTASDLGVASRSRMPVAHAASGRGSPLGLSWQLEKAHGRVACVLLTCSISCVDFSMQAARGLHHQSRRLRSARSKSLPQSEIRFHTMAVAADTVTKVLDCPTCQSQSGEASSGRE